MVIYIFFFVFLCYNLVGGCMNSLILLVFSVLPVLLIGCYIYYKDSSKEPKGFIIKLFLCGIGSFVLTIILSLIISIFYPALLASDYSAGLIELFFHVFLGIALVEEFSKWIFVYLFSYNSKHYDQFYDMIIYAVFVSLGFACIENIFYVFEHGFSTAIVRALLSVPGHACDGIFMGYYLSMAKTSSSKELSRKYLFMSILVPMLLHGFFDFCLFSKMIIFIVLFFIFVIFLYIFSIKKIKKVSAITGKIKYKDNFCPECGRKVDSDFCPNCGRKNE